MSAQDILTVRKVMDYLYSKLYGDKGLKDGEGELIECTECFDVYCNGKVRGREGERGKGKERRDN